MTKRADRADEVGDGPPSKHPNNRAASDCSPSPDTASSRSHAPAFNQIYSDHASARLAAQTRAAQACDRCKQRKIRCDGSKDACSPCQKAAVVCITTNKLTGEQETRGHTQKIQQENELLRQAVQKLEAVLKSRGVDTYPFQINESGRVVPPPGVFVDHDGNMVQSQESRDRWSHDDPIWIKKDRNNNGPWFDKRIDEVNARPTNGYIGFSSIDGTKLSLSDVTIDITSFDALDMDEPAQGRATTTPLYNKSLTAYSRSIYREQPPPPDVKLPSRDDVFQYSRWYFRTAHPFLPHLHEPSFMRTLTKIYDEPGFKPTIPELVTVHMVLAAMYFQRAVRTREGKRDSKQEDYVHWNDLSNQHYHWSLHQFYQLSRDTSVGAVQALAMIVVHTRSFPKPDCSTRIADYTLRRAIELNLHRDKNLPEGVTNLEVETQRRVWWTVLCLAVTLNGRLGRPMPISLDEFDTNLPRAVADKYITEDGIADGPGADQCAFLLGLTAWKMLPLYMHMYSNVYNVRRNTQAYGDVVHGLEEAMKDLQTGLPDSLKLDKCEQQQRFAALYVEAFALEFYLCLRHPSVCLTADMEFHAENTRICEETARKLLAVVSELRALNSLDTTWYQLSVYVAALFSILAAHWERRDRATEQDLEQLRADCRAWMTIVRSICIVVEPEAQFDLQIARVAQATISAIAAQIMTKRQNQGSQPYNQGEHQQLPPRLADRHSLSYQQPVPQLPQEIKPPPQDQMDGLSSDPHQHNGTAIAAEYYVATDRTNTEEYAATPSYATPANGGNNVLAARGGFSVMGAYNGPGNGQYVYSTGPNGNTSTTIGPSAPAANPLVGFAEQATAHLNASHPVSQANGSIHANWPLWATEMVNRQEDNYSASALMSLGAGQPNGTLAAGVMGGSGMAVPADTALVGQHGYNTQPLAWPPNLLFNGNSGQDFDGHPGQQFHGNPGPELHGGNQGSHV